jgi:hypothetical protein
VHVRRRIAWRLRAVAAWLDPDPAATRPQPAPTRPDPLPRAGPPWPPAPLPGRLDRERARHPDLHRPLGAAPWAAPAADPLGGIRSAFAPYHPAEVIRFPAGWAPCPEHQLAGCSECTRAW